MPHFVFKQRNEIFRRIVALTCAIAYLTNFSALADDALPSPTPSPTWSPQVSFEDQGNTGDLTIRIHPDSPTQCGLDMIEVGTQKEGGSFDPRFAMLRDRYNDTYPGVAPKIRRLYAYDMKPSSSLKDIKVLDTDTEKAGIILNLVYELTTVVMIATGTLVTEGLTVTVDQFVQSYLRNREYYRARDLYSLQLMLETKNPALKGTLSADEIQRILAYGREDGPIGLLVTDDYAHMVFQGQMDERREQRTSNYDNLLAAINREGLVAQPLFRDFVMVYYDPNRPTAHPINLMLTALQGSAEDKILQEQSASGKKGLVPLGLYAIGGQSDRLLTVDFTDSDHVADRTTTKMLENLAHEYTAAFLPFPFSWVIHGLHGGAELVLSKMGSDLLTDTLDTEGELAALLDSGVASLGPELLQQVRDGMGSETDNIILRIKQNAPEYRTENERAMTHMLQKRGKELCHQIAQVRESEFRSDYLSGGESIGRGLTGLWDWITHSGKASYKEERKEIIQGRSPLIDARKVLDTYDPTTSTDSANTIITALNTLAQARDPDDVQYFTKILKDSTDPDVLTAAATAAGVHGAAELDNVLADFLSTFDFSQELANTDAVSQALQSMAKIDITDKIDRQKTYLYVISVLNNIYSGPNKQFIPLTDQVYATLQEDYGQWTNYRVYKGAQ